MRRVLAALCLLVGLSAEAQVRTVWTNQAATATSSAYDTGRAQHTNIQIIGSSVVGTVDIEKSNDCSTWTNHQTLTDPSNTFLTLPSWACTRLVFTRTSGTITLATIEPVRTGRSGTMVGATSGAAGVGGLVPPPQAGDEAKTLLGDGTWGAGGGGSGDITGVTLTGTAPVTVTGSPCASGACVLAVSLTNMAIGTNLQAWDADLDGLAGLGNGYPYRASATWAVSSPTTGNVPYASAAGLVDSPLFRVDANTMAQVNGTTAQTFRLFKTNDGSAGAVGTNYAYLDITSDTNGGVIQWAKGGTGAGTFISFKVPASSYPAVWYVNNAQVGYVNPSGALNMTGGGAFGSHVTGCATCSLGQSGTQWQDGWFSRDLYANHLMGVGTAPTVGGSCGTSPTIAGKDSFFKITTGTGSPTSCTVTFGRAYSTAPVCVANAATTTTALLMTTTTTTAVVSSAALTAGEVLHVTCGGF